MSRKRASLLRVLGALFWLGVCAEPASAQEPEDVLLFEIDGLRPDLCAAVRIQLADVARVTCSAGSLGEALPQRVAEAVRQVDLQKARLGVFLERGPEGEDVRMYLVGARSDQAVLAIERIRDRPAPDVDRSLALKVRDTLDSARVAEQVSELNRERSLTVAALTEPTPARRESSTFSAWLEGGALLRAPQPLRAGLLLSVGGRYENRSFGLELGFVMRRYSEHRQRAAVGVVTENEWSGAVSVRALKKLGRFELGALAEAGALVARATGTTRTGQRGDGKERVPLFTMGADARVRLWGNGYVRVAPALELMAVEQRFALDDQVLYSAGKSHFLLPVSLLVQLPFAEIQR